MHRWPKMSSNLSAIVPPCGTKAEDAAKLTIERWHGLLCGLVSVGTDCRAVRTDARAGRPYLFWLVGYPSGQRGQTVNLLAYAFDGSNPSPTTTLKHRGNPYFVQCYQLFYQNGGFESVRSHAFTVSCVPVQNDAYKSITSQSMPCDVKTHPPDTQPIKARQWLLSLQKIVDDHAPRPCRGVGGSERENERDTPTPDVKEFLRKPVVPLIPPSRLTS